MELQPVIKRNPSDKSNDGSCGVRLGSAAALVDGRMSDPSAERDYLAITVPTSRIRGSTLLACRVLAERGLNVQLHSDRIMELARRAASETDSAKLLALVKELNKALVEDRARPKGNATEQQRTELERTG